MGLGEDERGLGDWLYGDGWNRIFLPIADTLGMLELRGQQLEMQDNSDNRAPAMTWNSQKTYKGKARMKLKFILGKREGSLLTL